MEEKAQKLSMSSIVLISFAIGILAGLFFGEMVAWMKFIGDAYIKLLQMTIIPYIIVSLISSLGKLSFEQAKELGLNVGKLMLVIWGIGLAVLYTVKLTFPEWTAGSFFSQTALKAPEAINFLDLYIPSNPFFSLSNSYIPAIVVFCVATGIALISIKEKDALLEPLMILGETFNKVTSYIVKLTPIGIFAMTAATAGTMEFDEFQKLQVYFVAHIFMTIVLTYLILPAIVASFTPFTYRDIVTIAQDAMIMAFAAGNIFIILPLLIERTKELFRKYNLDNKATENYPNIIIPVVFSFPNLGKLLTLVFVLFAAWFSGREVDFITYIPIAINGLISLFGSVYLTVPMLLDSLEISSDLFQLYMVSSLFTSRFTSLLAAMNIFILAVGGTAMLSGVAKISMKRIMFYSAVGPIVLGVTLLLTSMLLTQLVNTEYVMDEVVTHMTAAEDVPDSVKVTMAEYSGQSAPRSLLTIQHEKELRVGYRPNLVPFSYFNVNEELVGFDVDMVKKLASELGVKLKFVPYQIENLTNDLNNGRFDIAISGIQMTTDAIQKLDYSIPVLELHYAAVVKDHYAKSLRDETFIKKQKELRFAAVGNFSIFPSLKKKHPNITIEVIDSELDFFKDDGRKWDGLITSLEAGKAWTILHPEYTTIYDRERIRSYPAAYAVAKGNLSLHTFVNSWLTIQKSSNYLDSLYDYWILGKNAVPYQPRWSVIKDVLHWVDVEQ